MPVLADRDTCCGCGACAYRCPLNLIEMKTDEEGFLQPAVTNKGCIECKACEHACPVLKTAEEPDFIALAAVNTDDEIREKSSSGGAFWPLVLDTLARGGAVCGPVFNEHFELKHVLAEDMEGAAKMRRSKYLQSDMQGIFKAIEASTGPVLFSGTPCQTNAVGTVFAGEERVLTLAVACHGVPSPLVFSSYLHALERRYIAKAVGVDFKDKSIGWKSACAKIDFENGESYVERLSGEPYMQAFLKNLTVRRSCQHCVSKKMPFCDILIGDFWGVNKLHPEMDDDRGTSVVLIGSEKGALALDRVKDGLRLKSVALEDAVQYNPYIFGCGEVNPKREDFIADCLHDDFFDVAKRYIKEPSLMQKVKHRLKKLLK